MKCPYCEHPLTPADIYCSACKQPLPTRAGDAPQMPVQLIDRWFVRLALFVLSAIIAALILGFGVYKLYFWAQDYQIARLYGRGERTPVISEVTLPDGRTAHAINFFADDGDQIYIPELNRSTAVSGRVAHIEIPDSQWFSGDLTDVESALVSLSPVLIAEGGGRTQLPTIDLTIAPPQSPLKVISPARDGISVFTSVYPLEIQVVPGSTVIINGEDETDVADRSGLLSANISVYPVGDNTVTILVRTPDHAETRKDVVIHRADQDIEIELNKSIGIESDARNMPVSGTCEPGAMIEVDSPHIEESVYIDQMTGKFEFLTAFDNIGENVVRFRATMDGRRDAEVHFSVNYRPTYPNYTNGEWPMRENYAQLRNLYAQWHQRRFICRGTVLDVFAEDGNEYIVMDAGPEGEPMIVVLINQSTHGTPLIGTKYDAHAHVEGRYMYNTQYYPMLITLYMDLTKTD